MLKQSVEIRNPQDQDDDHQAIQDRFDLSLHGDESVHEPQQDACCNNRDEDGGKWHFVFSNHSSNSIPQGIVEKLQAFESLGVQAIRRRGTMTPLHFHCSKSLEK